MLFKREKKARSPDVRWHDGKGGQAGCSTGKVIC
jgi:hypothetical protein